MLTITPNVIGYYLSVSSLVILYCILLIFQRCLLAWPYGRRVSILIINNSIESLLIMYIYVI